MWKNIAVFIPIVAIVFSLSIPIIAIITDAAKRRKIYELHHKERLAAIEKGIELPPLPPELLDRDFGRRARKPRSLLNGLVWLLVGLGLLVALYFDPYRREWASVCLDPSGHWSGVSALLCHRGQEGRGAGRRPPGQRRPCEGHSGPRLGGLDQLHDQGVIRGRSPSIGLHLSQQSRAIGPAVLGRGIAGPSH